MEIGGPFIDARGKTVMHFRLMRTTGSIISRTQVSELLSGLRTRHESDVDFS